jgi:hypothetical protein
MYAGLRARTPGQASAPNLLSRGRWGRAGFYNQRLCERPGQLEAIFDASGVSCEILVGGKLGVGDAVTPAPPTSPGQATVRDVGTQPDGYYVRPSKRTAAMIKGAGAHMTRTLEELVKTDPAGAARAEAAYNSVGLGFWPARAWQQAKRVWPRRLFLRSVFITLVVAAAAVYFELV